MNMIITSRLNGKESRELKHYSSEADFLRALDRVERSAWERQNVRLYRFDSVLTVEGSNGIITFSPDDIGD